MSNNTIFINFLDSKFCEIPKKKIFEDFKNCIFFHRIKKTFSDQHSFRRDEPDDLADEIEHINRAVEHCERRNQHEVTFFAKNTVFD